MVVQSRIALIDLVMCLSEAVDLISSEVTNHHKRVGYIASKIGRELGVSPEEQNRLLLGGALHDIGAISFQERIDTLQFEVDNPHRHGQLGYWLLHGFEPLGDAAALIRYHHWPWNPGDAEDRIGDSIPLGSHIIHLADRIDVLIDKQVDILSQVGTIQARVEEEKGRLFAPRAVEAFGQLADKEYFWLDLMSPFLDHLLRKEAHPSMVELDLDGLYEFARFFAQVIDFRSRFTSTHSWGVAASGKILAQRLGFSNQECRMMEIAGYLHDLGKLAIPTEILEKPGRLTEEEFSRIRSHTYYTYRILDHIPGLETINAWASLHHERLDGQGYPFHYGEDNLSLGSRIMAVADIFTALTEDRPYRKAMDKGQVMDILYSMVKHRGVDETIVTVLEQYYKEINRARMEAQEEAEVYYDRLQRQLAL